LLARELTTQAAAIRRAAVRAAKESLFNATGLLTAAAQLVVSKERLAAAEAAADAAFKQYEKQQMQLLLADKNSNIVSIAMQQRQAAVDTATQAADAAEARLNSSVAELEAKKQLQIRSTNSSRQHWQAISHGEQPASCNAECDS